MSLIFPYFIRALPELWCPKCSWLLDTYSPNYRELDKSRRDEKYYSRHNRELDNSRRDENSNSRRNRELSNSLLRRDLLFSFLFLWWFFGELAILVEFSDENYWQFDENYWILSSNSVILVEISTRIAEFEERICKFSSAQLYGNLRVFSV